MNQKIKFVLVAVGFFVAGVIVSGIIRNQVVENLGASALSNDVANQAMESVSIDNTNTTANKGGGNSFLNSYAHSYIKTTPGDWLLEFCNNNKDNVLVDDEGGMTNDCPAYGSELHVQYYSGGGQGTVGESSLLLKSFEAGHGGGAGQGGRSLVFQYNPSNIVYQISGTVGIGGSNNNWAGYSDFWAKDKFGNKAMAVSIPGSPPVGSTYIDNHAVNNTTAVLTPIPTNPKFLNGSMGKILMSQLDQGMVGSDGYDATSPGEYGSTIIKVGWLGIKTKIKIDLSKPPFNPPVHMPPKANGTDYINCFGGEGGVAASQPYAQGGHGGRGGDLFWSDVLNGNIFNTVFLNKCVHKNDTHLNDGRSDGGSGALFIGWN